MQRHPQQQLPGELQQQELQGEGERKPTELVESVLRWVTFKELVFVFIACNVVAGLLRVQDRLEFKAVWNHSLSTEHYSNRKFPFRMEKMLAQHSLYLLLYTCQSRDLATSARDLPFFHTQSCTSGD